jgi:hypothetical protein
MFQQEFADFQRQKQVVFWPIVAASRRKQKQNGRKCRPG